MKRVMLPSLVLAGVLCAACESDPETFEMVFDPCAPLVLEPDPEATADERASLGDAVALWTEVAEVRLTFADVPGARRLPVRMVESNLFMGRYDDRNGRIDIARRVDERHARSIVMAHEIGHAFGLYHVDRDEHLSVMNKGNIEVAPTEEDVASLRAVWGECVTTPPAPVSPAPGPVTTPSR